MNKTPLYDIHIKLNAQMVDFHGWLMPIQYTSIIKEHLAVRKAVGILDISHMGRIYVSGNEALQSLQKVLTQNLARLKVGDASYNLILNDNACIIDDIIAYRIETSLYLLVVNASNREKDLKWLNGHIFKDVNIDDKTSSTAIIAIQGPKAEELLKDAAGMQAVTIKRWQCEKAKVCGIDSLVLRTSYTGDDGFELLVSSEDAPLLWNRLSLEGERFGIMPVGLGARDTLRLEAGLALYGQDINEDTNPLEAGLDWAIDLTKKDFIGRNALMRLKKSQAKRRLINFQMLERGGIPRRGFPIYLNGKRIGEITSGSYCPSIDKNIGLGFIDVDNINKGARIEIEIRGKRYQAVIG